MTASNPMEHVGLSQWEWACVLGELYTQPEREFQDWISRGAVQGYIAHKKTPTP